MSAARLVIKALCKSYVSPVLTNVDLQIQKGEIHALVGENGAGKTTLVNILTGIVDRDEGGITLDGVSYAPSTPRQAFAAGVSVATQELSIIGTLSIAENISLKALPAAGGVIDREKLARSTNNALGLMGLENADPSVRAETLSLSDQQLVELAKSIQGTDKLLILDEPTAALTAPQADRLHTVMRSLTEQGTSIIYISHRLQDVLDIADTVSVLRDGRIVLSDAARSLTIDKLVHAMAGQNLDQVAAASTSGQTEAPAIKAESVTTSDLPKPVDFEAHAGEIVGLSGLAGAGRSELLQALFGIASPTGGRVVRVQDGNSIEVRNPKQAIDLGIAMLGEDRQAMGLFEGQTVTTNLMIPGSKSRTTLIDRAQEAKASRDLVERVDIRCESIDQNIAELSGGNQQKSLLARWLHRDSDVYLLDEPTRGVDVGTRFAIYALLRELAADGKCVVVASSENEELMALCHRIIVLSNRKIAGTFDPRQCSEEDLLSAAFSAFTAESTSQQDVLR